MGFMSDMLEGFALVSDTNEMYKMGYKHGRKGEPRVIIDRKPGKSFKLIERAQQFYDKGYDDGKQQQILDKLG